MMTDEELAKARQGIPIDVNPDGTPTDAMLSLMAELVVQTTRLANNTSKAEKPHVSVRELDKAWEAIGMRMYPEKAAEFAKALGMVVDE